MPARKIRASPFPQPLAADRLRPAGELNDRIQRLARRLLLDDVYRPEWITSDITFEYDPTPYHDWYTGHEWTWFADVSGRYLNAWVSLAPFANGLPDKARAVAETVFANQAGDGHFGPPRTLDACDRSQASGTAWMLLALPRYFALTGDERALTAARRLAGWYAATLPYWQRPEVLNQQVALGSYALILSNFTHCLDGLAALWQVDPQDRYVALARGVAALVRTFDQEIHSHHFLSTLRGLLDWHLLTGDPAFLDKALPECGRVAADGLLDTCGVPECFTNPGTDEGCSEVDWVLLNLKLWQITGERGYLEMAERAVYSHLYMSQTQNGGFGHWQGFHGKPGGAPGPGTVGRYTEAFWCCTMHGAYGLTELARHVFAVAGDGNRVAVNLFMDGAADVRTPHGTARLRLDAQAYPWPGVVHLDAELPPGARLGLDVRLPAHSPLRQATLDGQPCGPAGTAAAALALDLSAPGHHRLTLEFAPAVRAEPARRKAIVGDRVSLWYGPMLLGTNACMRNVRYRLDAATLAGMKPEPCRRPGAWPSEVEFSLPATDAPEFAHTRDRHRMVLYPMAAHGYRKFAYITYVF